MDKIIKFFDDFTFYGRVMPVLVILLPILIFGIYKKIIGDNILENSLYTVFMIILLAFTSKIAREYGSRYEKEMYLELKEKPTTIVLRYSDNTIDATTKKRYHEKLNKMIADMFLPITEKDENISSDEQYSSCINWLRDYANSHRETEPRVYQELKDYNFWRNLYGSKFIAIGIYLFIAMREFILINNFNIREMIVKPYPTYVPFLIMLVSIIFMLFFVNKNTVKIKAFDYARSLVEVCERL